MPLEGEGEPYGLNEVKADKTPSKTEELIEPGELHAPTQRKNKISKATNSSKAYLQYPFLKQTKPHSRLTDNQPVQSTRRSCWVVPTTRTLVILRSFLFFHNFNSINSIFISWIYFPHSFPIVG